MPAVITIAINDLRIYLQDRSNLVFLTIMPIIFVLVIGSVFTAGDGGDGPVVPIDLVDEDNSAASAALVEALLEANPRVIICPAAAVNYEPDDNPCITTAEQLSQERAQERLQEGMTYAVLTIPAGYEAAMQAGEPFALTFQSDPTLSAPDIARRAIESVILRMGSATIAAQLSTDMAAEANLVDENNRQEYYQARFDEAQAAWGPPAPILIKTEATLVEPVAEEENDQPSGGFSGGFNQSATGMAAMYAMINVVGLAATLVQERQDGTLPRLLVMPITKLQILGGKLLRGYGLGLLQFFILLGVGALLGVNFGQNIPAVLLITLVYVLTVSAMAIFMATIARTPEQASGFALLASMTLAPLGGAWWPLEVVPQFMQTIGHISPIAWCMDAFNTVLYHGGGIPEIIVPVLVMLGMALVFLVLGIMRFKYE